MLKNNNLEFSFKGSRSYIHGTDIFNKLLNILEKEMQKEKFDLTFHGVAQKNISLTTEKPNQNILKFACKYIDVNNNKKVLYGIENNNKIESNYPYSEEDICNLSKLNLDNKEVVLDKISSFSFIENIVALNKYLLESLFPNVKGKWYFTRLQIHKIPHKNSYPLKLLLKANFNFKLTKTEILINNTSIGYIYFSLV